MQSLREVTQTASDASAMATKKPRSHEAGLDGLEPMEALAGTEDVSGRQSRPHFVEFAVKESRGVGTAPWMIEDMSLEDKCLPGDKTADEKQHADIHGISLFIGLGKMD